MLLLLSFGRWLLLHALLLLLLLLGLGLVDRRGVHERDFLLVLCNISKINCVLGQRLVASRQQVFILSFLKLVNRFQECRLEKVA